MDQALIDEMEKDLTERKNLFPWLDTKEEEKNLSKLKALNEKHGTRIGLRYEVPDDKCCYFCLKKKAVSART